MANFGSSIPVSGLEWKIENVLSMDHAESVEFILYKVRWRLRLCPYLSDYIMIYLNKANSEKLVGTYKVRCFVVNSIGKSVDIREHVLDDPDFAIKQISWINKDVFQSQRDIYLTGGTLTFVVVFTPITTLKEEGKVSDKSIQTYVNMADLENLSLDLSNLLDGGVQSDVALKCEESSFSAHRGILSARSEVFSAMLRSDMAENRTGVIEITDMDASVLDQLLHYIYSGKFSDLSVDSAPKLYAAADKYSVESLKKLCAEFMKENLTRENACRFLVLADTHGDIYLKDYVLCFIKKVELLRNKDIWFEFHEQHPKLAIEVLHHAYDAKCLSKEA